MNKQIYYLTILFLTIFTSIQANAQATCASPCASYSSAYPPPYPCTYPCMQSFLLADPYCCSQIFDDYCYSQLKLYCDVTADLCKFEQCSPNGCTLSNVTFCSSSQQVAYPCPSYSTAQPPPGSNQPTTIDGILFEMMLDFNDATDGTCCFEQWDYICWQLLDSLAILSETAPINSGCNDGDPSTIDGISPDLGCVHTPIVSGGANYIIAKIKVFLEGAYNTTTNAMNTNLRNQNLIPKNQPFNADPWFYNGTESVALPSDIPSNAVDWVLLELRQATDNNIVLARRACFLLSNGTIKDVDPNITAGAKFAWTGMAKNTNYYIVVRARNHMAVMSSFPVFLSNTAIYDFSIASQQARGENQQKLLDANSVGILDDTYGLYAGDFDSDGDIVLPDYNVFKFSSQLAKIKQYFNSDANLDGISTFKDFNLWRNNLYKSAITQVKY